MAQYIPSGFEFDLNKIRARLHIIDGLLKAINMIDEVVRTIKQSSDTRAANVALQSLLSIDEAQAKAILGNANVKVTISVVDGEGLAQRTFNPRLGITGGISIVGVSGIIKPFSEEAFVESTFYFICGINSRRMTRLLTIDHSEIIFIRIRIQSAVTTVCGKSERGTYTAFHISISFHLLHIHDCFQPFFLVFLF